MEAHLLVSNQSTTGEIPVMDVSTTCTNQMFNKEYKREKEELRLLLKELREDREELHILLNDLRDEVKRDYDDLINSPNYEEMMDKVSKGLHLLES